jgi:hypothetical protein
MRKPLDILYNFHWIVPGEAARASQAYMGLLGLFLRSNKLKAMINLRGRPPRMAWVGYETRVCEEHSVAHFDAMLDSRKLPLQRMLVTLIDAFEAAPRPFVIKCSGGQDRTSFAAALFLLHQDGWQAVEKAQRQFRRFPYLHFPRKHQRWLSQFLRYAQEQARGRALAAWIRDDYDPAHLAHWLEAKGMADFFAGIWEPWPVKR